MKEYIGNLPHERVYCEFVTKQSFSTKFNMDVWEGFREIKQQVFKNIYSFKSKLNFMNASGIKKKC